MNIYTFYKYNDDDKKIIIGSPSFFEAINVICEMYDNASSIYNFKEYKIEHINDLDLYYKTLNIEDAYQGIPYILTNNQYETLKDKGIFNDVNKIQIDKKVIDKSHIDNKYNGTLLNKNDISFENCVKRINEKNGINYDNVLKVEDNETINKIIDKIFTLNLYVDKINDKDIRNYIKNNLNYIKNNLNIIISNLSKCKK